MAKAKRPRSTGSAIDRIGIPTFSPSALRAKMKAALQKASDPRHGSALGRLHMAGRITDAEYRAGGRFAEVHRRWRQVQGIRSSTPKSPDFERISGAPIDPDEAAVVAANAEEARARSAVLKAGGAALWKALEAVCDLDRDPPPQVLPALRVGLRALATAWGLCAPWER